MLFVRRLTPRSAGRLLHLILTCLLLPAVAGNAGLRDESKHDSPETGAAAPKPNGRRPNIVLLFVDDLGWSDLGYRNPMFETPHIDRLASDGVDFTQAYVASPTCSPSRATLVTGQHPARLRIVRHIPTGPKHPAFDQFGRTSEEFNLWPRDPAQFPCRNWLPLEHTTYAEALRDLGYYNLFLGKWHLGHEPYHPVRQGFDRQIGTTNWGHPKSYKPPFFQNSPVLADETERYLTDRLTDETVKFLSEYDGDKPFMLSLWYYNVHNPLIGRDDLVRKFADRGLEGQRLQYAAMVAAVDESVGRIRTALESNGIADDTIVLLTSDQGSWFENPPYRGSKRVDTLGEGGARVPFIVHWPGVTKPGRMNDSVIQTTDVFPTLVEIAGGDPAEFDNLDGVSLVGTLRTGDRVERGEPIFGYRAYEDLYASVREGPWKLLAYRSGRLQLYNVETDRYEQNDVITARPEIAQRLRSKLTDWEKKMGVEKYSGVQ